MTRAGFGRVGWVVAIACASVPSARGDVLTVYGDAHGGAMFGRGTSGDDAVKEQAFFADVPNLTYGLAVSARFLFLGATLQHHQYNDGSELATWTQLTAGLDMVVDLGSSAAKSAKSSGFVEFGAGVGFGVGTGQQVDPPLSDDEISDKALLVSGRLGLGKHLGDHLDVGVLVPVTYGYFIKNGVPANVLENHYRGFHVEALGYLRLRFKLL